MLSSRALRSFAGRLSLLSVHALAAPGCAQPDPLEDEPDLATLAVSMDSDCSPPMPSNWVPEDAPCSYVSPCQLPMIPNSICDDGYRAYWEPVRKLVRCEQWTDTSADPVPLRGLFIQVRNGSDQIIFQGGIGDQSMAVNGQCGDETDGVRGPITSWSDPDMRVKIASSTKAVTAVTALAALRARYSSASLESTLNRKVGSYLDTGMCGAGAFSSIPPSSPVRDITIGQLMSFTSGLGEASSYSALSGAMPKSCVGKAEGYTTISCACEILQFANDHQSASIADPSVSPLTEPLPIPLGLTNERPERFYFHEPGATFKYHEQHLTVLAAVVQHATGKSMNEHLNDRIAKPLGINTAAVRNWYYGNDPEAAYLGTDENPSYAASIASTVDEFMRFEAMIAHRGLASQGGPRVVQQEVITVHETAGFSDIRAVPASPKHLGDWNGYFAQGSTPAFVVALFGPNITYPEGYPANGSPDLTPDLYGRNSWLRAARVNTGAGFEPMNPYCLFKDGCPSPASRPYGDGRDVSAAQQGLSKINVSPSAFMVDSVTLLGPSVPDAYQWLGHDGKNGWTPWVDRVHGIYAVIGKYRPSGGGPDEYAPGDTTFSKTLQAMITDLVQTYGDAF